MIEWVRDGTLPPPSVYPRVSDGTLVPANDRNGMAQHPRRPKSTA